MRRARFHAFRQQEFPQSLIGIAVFKSDAPQDQMGRGLIAMVRNRACHGSRRLFAQAQPALHFRQSERKIASFRRVGADALQHRQRLIGTERTHVNARQVPVALALALHHRAGPVARRLVDIAEIDKLTQEQSRIARRHRVPWRMHTSLAINQFPRRNARAFGRVFERLGQNPTRHVSACRQTEQGEHCGRDIQQSGTVDALVAPDARPRHRNYA